MWEWEKLKSKIEKRKIHSIRKIQRRRHCVAMEPVVLKSYFAIAACVWSSKSIRFLVFVPLDLNLKNSNCALRAQWANSMLLAHAHSTCSRSFVGRCDGDRDIIVFSSSFGCCCWTSAVLYHGWSQSISYVKWCYWVTIVLQIEPVRRSSSHESLSLFSIVSSYYSDPMLCTWK